MYVNERLMAATFIIAPRSVEKFTCYLNIRSAVMHLVFQSQTLEQQGVFENVRVIDDHCFLEKNLM